MHQFSTWFDLRKATCTPLVGLTASSASRTSFLLITWTEADRIRPASTAISAQVMTTRIELKSTDGLYTRFSTSVDDPIRAYPGVQQKANLMARRALEEGGHVAWWIDARHGLPRPRSRMNIYILPCLQGLFECRNSAPE